MKGLLNRDDYVHLVEKRYFGNVSRKDLRGVLDCFTPDARVTIYHGDAPPRVFQADGLNGEPLERFFQHLWRHYDPAFSDFTHYVDTQAGRCASTFVVRLTPSAESAQPPEGRQTLRNCNFFLCRGDRIADMIIYYANPQTVAGRRSGAPTGYPPA